jgi:hypothetical protein
MTVVDLTRQWRRARLWLDEVPEWARIDAAGTVETYHHDPGPPTLDRPRRAAWAMAVPFGGHSWYGLLGAEHTPHAHPYLRVLVDVGGGRGTAEEPSPDAEPGLPYEYVGAVLAGAVAEPALLGAGTLHVRWAATHPVDSAWEALRVVAAGLVRLLATPGEPPPDLLPFFGGSTPPPPGGGPQQ